MATAIQVATTSPAAGKGIHIGLWTAPGLLAALTNLSRGDVAGALFALTLGVLAFLVARARSCRAHEDRRG